MNITHYHLITNNSIISQRLEIHDEKPAKVKTAFTSSTNDLKGKRRIVMILKFLAEVMWPVLYILFIIIFSIVTLIEFRIDIF